MVMWEIWIRAVKREEPDMILHLGDCVVDADALRREFPHITMVNVPGNCDFSRGDTERLIDIDGYKVLTVPWTYIWSKDVIYASGASCEGSRGRPGALWTYTQAVL